MQCWGHIQFISHIPYIAKALLYTMVNVIACVKHFQVATKHVMLSWGTLQSSPS